MGGEQAVPLDDAVLKPLQTMNAIADDDPYWQVLGTRTHPTSFLSPKPIVE